MKYAKEKLDPTIHDIDDESLSRVTLMFAATSGDVFELQKYVCILYYSSTTV